MNRCASGQRGAALITALCLVLVVLMIGLSAARAAFSAAKSSRYERDRLVAFAAAEAALADAQHDIEGPARAAMFDPANGAFAEGCGGPGSAHGLCQPAGKHAYPAWQAANLTDPHISAAYGEFTGARMATDAPGQPLQLPRYVIELLPAGRPATPGTLLRITAAGFGSHARTLVVLQALYHKAPAAPLEGKAGESASLPPGRAGWREIAHWAELHEAAHH